MKLLKNKIDNAILRLVAPRMTRDSSLRIVPPKTTNRMYHELIASKFLDLKAILRHKLYIYIFSVRIH